MADDYTGSLPYPQPVNPLTNLGAVAGIANTVTSNKLRQLELQGEVGKAQLYNSAPRDASGSIDQNYILQNANQAGVLAPDVIQAAQGAQLTGQQVQQQQIATARSKASLMGASLLPVLKNPNATPADFVAALNTGKAASGGLLTDKDYAPIFQAMATNLVQGGSVHDHAQQIVGQSLAMGGDLDAGSKLIYGSPTALSTGGGTMTGTQNPTTGAITPGSYVPNTLPATTTQQVASGPNAGATTYVGQAGPPTVQPAGSVGSAASPLAGAFAPPGKDGSTGGGPVLAALPPGQQAMLGDAGKAAQKRVDDTIQGAQQARVSQDVNQQVVNLAKELGDNVGPVSTNVTSILGKLSDAPGIGPILKAVRDKDPADTAGQLMELQKYLLRSAQMRGDALGLGGTDYQTSLLQNANPHDTQFPQTIQKLAKYNMVLDNIQQGKANAMDQFPDAKTSPAANQDFENQMRNAMNPDVYRALLASPSERKELYANMSSQQKYQMVQDRRKLIALGAIPPQLQAGGASQ